MEAEEAAAVEVSKFRRELETSRKKTQNLHKEIKAIKALLEKGEKFPAERRLSLGVVRPLPEDEEEE